MLERFERPLRMLCLALAAVLLFQFVRLVLRGDPLAHLDIPQLPSLAGTTNAPSTNAPATNQIKGLAAPTNAPGSNGVKALAAISNAPGTNLVQMTNQSNGTNATNGTNKMVTSGTNAPNGPPKAGRPKGMPGGRMAGGPPHLDLPPAVQSRVDKITDSEILGPVMHPQPMGLIGIADEEAIIRAPNGQTGVVKVNGELGGIKLLRIGINRVLVEEDGEPKELTIFEGIGGQSLMPKPTNTPPSASTNSLSQTNKTLPSKPKETH